MEIASNKSSSEELLNILSKFTEIPDKVKLVQLSHLMYKSEKPKKERGVEFKTLLTSLPIDLVKFLDFCKYLFWKIGGAFCLICSIKLPSVRLQKS